MRAVRHGIGSEGENVRVLRVGGRAGLVGRIGGVRWVRGDEAGDEGYRVFANTEAEDLDSRSKGGSCPRSIDGSWWRRSWILHVGLREDARISFLLGRRTL